MSIPLRIRAKKFGASSRPSKRGYNSAEAQHKTGKAASHSSCSHVVVTKSLHCVRIMVPRETYVTSDPLSAVDPLHSNHAEIIEETSEKLPPSKKYPGALIVVEGIDGSGKSTQLYLLKRWLEINGYRLHFTEWNSSPLVKSATRRGKQRRLLTPTTFSLLHAADFADRCERQIMPLLHSGYLVLADRYIYTAFARDVARHCSPRWLRNLYRFAPVPDITFYFRAPLDVAVKRIMSGRPKLKYYEAGMDLNLSLDRAESFRIFQGRILAQYDEMVESDNFVVMDGTLAVNSLQKQMRQMVKARIDLARFAPKKSTRRPL
jgi:dTMP kinase